MKKIPITSISKKWYLHSAVKCSLKAYGDWYEIFNQLDIFTFGNKMTKCSQNSTINSCTCPGIGDLDYVEGMLACLSCRDNDMSHRLYLDG
jgi:hypothetical protein